MNSIKRLFISVKGQIDQVADEFENHEALAELAIQDLHAITNKTRAQLHRLATLTKSYQTQLDEQQQQAYLWTQRAITAKKQDPQIALQCVKRLRDTQNKITLLEQQHQESRQQEDKVQNDLTMAQQQLSILKNKKEMLKVRENRSHLQASLQTNSPHSLDTAQQVFERWETKLVGTELETPTEIDDLSFQFEQEEEMLALQQMLDALEDTDTPSKGDSHE